MPEQRFEYQPRKSRVPRIIAQILSTLFTAVLVSGLVSCFTTDLPKYIPFEKVNLYNINDNDIYELKDVTVVSKYASDEYIDYYLVLLPYKDETIKAASLSCQNGYDFNINIRKQLNNKNTKLGDCKISAGITADYIDMLYDDIEEDYHKAVESLKDSGMNVMSTELDFDYECEANEKDFRDYYDTEKSDRIFLAFIFSVLSIIGGALMFASFWESKSKYQPASNYPGVYFEPNFNNRFE